MIGITGQKHQELCTQLQKAIDNECRVNNTPGVVIKKDLKTLSTDKHTIETLYTSYLDKLNELQEIIKEYEKAHRSVRIRLRQYQLGCKLRNKINLIKSAGYNALNKNQE